MKYFVSFLLFLFVAICAQAQSFRAERSDYTLGVQPFVFSLNTLTIGMRTWNLDYKGGYGRNVEGPFGFDGVDQQFALKGYLGDRFTVFANFGLGFDHAGHVNSFEQVEILHDIIGGKKFNSSRLGIGLGLRREWGNEKVLFSRIEGMLRKSTWRAIGNVRIEKAFDEERDEVDVITSAGYQHQIVTAVYGGVEAVAEDLEGFWNDEEAEGGAKILAGPSINFRSKSTPFSITLSGGPSFYLTKNKPINDNDARRELGEEAVQNGYALRFNVNYAF